MGLLAIAKSLTGSNYIFPISLIEEDIPDNGDYSLGYFEGKVKVVDFTI